MPGYTFTKDSARRIAAATRLVEGPQRRAGLPALDHRARGVEGLTIGKTSTAWTKGTEATIAVHSKEDRTATGGTATAWNLFADIEAGKWVAILDGYLISAEC